MAQYEVKFAGFGGQGIMTAGQLLAYTGIEEGKQVVWLPSYGPEMRGGTAYCTVIISDERIGSPIVTNPRALCVFNRPSFEKFEPLIKPGGLLVVNSSLIDLTTERDDLTELLVPANEIAVKAGNLKSANVAVLGAFVGASGVVKQETLVAMLKAKMGKKKEMLEANLSVLDTGFKLGQGISKRRVAR